MAFATHFRAATPLLVAAAVLTSCGGASYGPIRGASAYDHTARIVAMSPRQPGSENLRKVAAYIEQQLQAIDTSLKLQRQPFTRPKLAPGIEYQNLWVEIPGADPDGPILAIGAHYDSKITHPGEQDFEFLGAIDSAGSCGVLLELARQLHAGNPISPNIWLIWFDGEESIEWEWNDDLALFGSNHFVTTMAADAERFPSGLARRMRVFVLLDLLGDAVMKIDRDTESNPALLDIFETTAEELGAAEMMYRYQSPMKDDHIPFKQRGVRVIDLIDFRYRPPIEHYDGMPEEARQYFPWWHTPDDTLDRVSADSLDLAGNLVWHALPKIEAEFYK